MRPDPLRPHPTGREPLPVPTRQPRQSRTGRRTGRATLAGGAVALLAAGLAVATTLSQPAAASTTDAA
ncbi:MAG TPA: hypothetical protein VHA75_18980, partial [Rugosimonospora sp.]|nr:hypothetical protein [Rugosimonospora sp.]